MKVRQPSKRGSEEDYQLESSPRTANKRNQCVDDTFANAPCTVPVSELLHRLLSWQEDQRPPSRKSTALDKLAVSSSLGTSGHLGGGVVRH